MDVDAADLLLHAGVVLERVRRLVQLDLRLADRLALFRDQDGHELADVGLEGLGAGVEDHAAVRVPEPTPRPLRRMRRAHHGVDLAGARGGDLADELPGAGVDDRQGGRGRRHAPTNSGARFSTNAFRPSLASLEWNSDSISSPPGAGPSRGGSWPPSGTHA